LRLPNNKCVSVFNKGPEDSSESAPAPKPADTTDPDTQHVNDSIL